MIKRLKLKFKIFLFLNLILIFVLHNISSKNEYELNFDIVLKEPLNKSTELLRSANFDKYCDLKGEWSNLNNEHFFKNGSSFYIIDQSRAHIYFLTRSKKINELELLLSVKINKKEEFKFKVRGKASNPWFVNGYASCSISFFFNLKEILYTEKKIDLIQNLNRIEISCHIRDIKKNKWTTIPLNLKLKNLQKEKKKSAILCAKCLYLNANEYLHLNWWIELNKRGGYEKIVICNQSMESNYKKVNRLDFADVINSYGDFIELEQLECIPDLTSPISSQARYFNTFKMLKLNGHFNGFMVETINILVLSQCYLDNVDKYEYVGIFDNDETVLPKLSNHFSKVSQSIELIKSYHKENHTNFADYILNDKCNSLDTSLTKMINQKNNQIYSYLKNVEKTQQINETSMYFKQAYFVSFQFVANVFDQISNYFASNLLKNGHKHSITVIHEESIGQNESKLVNFTIEIANKKEYDYTTSLISIFNSIIRVYVDDNKDIIHKYADRYLRLFLLFSESSLAKTIHNTRSTFEFTVHQPYAYLNKENNFYSHIDYDNGYLHHFRRTYSFNLKKLSISKFYLDLNYFNCYFKPIIESFKIS